VSKSANAIPKFDKKKYLDNLTFHNDLEDTSCYSDSTSSVDSFMPREIQFKK